MISGLYLSQQDSFAAVSIDVAVEHLYIGVIVD